MTIDRQESVSDRGCVITQCVDGVSARERKNFAQQSDAEHFAATWVRRDIRSQPNLFTRRQAFERRSVSHKKAVPPGPPYSIQDFHRLMMIASHTRRSEFSA